MPQVSIGQVENLEDLMHGLQSVQETLESACREQIAAAECQFEEAREETKNSERMLEQAFETEQSAQRAVAEAECHLKSAENWLSAAESALAACEAQGPDVDGDEPDCSGEEANADEARSAVADAQSAVETAREALEKAKENRQRMEQRLDITRQALAMAEQSFEQARMECTSRLHEVSNVVDRGKTRLRAAQRALDVYLASNPPSVSFREWLRWHPEHEKPITPDVIRDRMNLSHDQQRLLHEYLYDRNPAYRNRVDKHRAEWAAAKGDVERDIVNRKVRIQLSGEYAEHMARYAVAPLGRTIETQGRTYVGEGGRYTKTDLIVKDLSVPVILGRGEGMSAQVGDSMAFEVKCGKAEYLYSQKSHMQFQAEGHKQAVAHCTLCSRDIHDLPPEKEKDVREAMRAAGSPLVGMLPAKKDIDDSCLAFIRQDREDDRK